MRMCILNIKMENIYFFTIINKICINDTTITTPYSKSEREFCSINVIPTYAFYKSFYSIKCYIYSYKYMHINIAFGKEQTSDHKCTNPSPKQLQSTLDYIQHLLQLLTGTQILTIYQHLWIRKWAVSCLTIESANPLWHSVEMKFGWT